MLKADPLLVKTYMPHAYSDADGEEAAAWHRAEHHRIWLITRSVLETDNYKHKRYSGQSKSHWDLFEHLIQGGAWLLKAVGLYERGYRNARAVMFNEVTLSFAALPPAFEGYQMLHLTDLHLDCIDGLDEVICRRIEGLSYDLCVITGDYREQTHGRYRHILPPMQRIAEAINAPDGTLVTLGNHDTYQMVKPFEEMGMWVLGNETVTLRRGAATIQVTGVDDPHSYYTDQALDALEATGEGFKIALVHAPGLFDLAAANGYHLYLCGHTHGGQICLPGGVPLITHTRKGRTFYKGLWSYDGMIGYTSRGCGTSGIPIRFNTRGEIVRYTLTRASL